MPEPSTNTAGGGASSGETAPAVVDPLVGYRFSVTVSGAGGLLFGGYFSEIGGLNVELSAVEYKTFNGASGLPVTQYVAGRINPGQLTLKRGLAPDLSFFNWVQMVFAGRMMDARASVTITMYTSTFDEGLQWTLYDAWPSKFSVDSLSSSAGDFHMEELTLVYERMSMTTLQASGGSTPQ